MCRKKRGATVATVRLVVLTRIGAAATATTIAVAVRPDGEVPAVLISATRWLKRVVP